MRNDDSGVRLTARDFGILRDVYENTFLTFSQIHGRHFNSAARVTVQNRLSQLTLGGFLNRIRVGSVVYQAKPQFIGVIYLMTRLGLRNLKLKHPELEFRDEPVVLDATSLVHDLRLVEVRDFLRNRFGNCKWVNAKNILRESKSNTRRPDLIGIGPNGKITVAVELDLTVKSERTYREIINQYGMSLEYNAVLYVVGSKAIGEKIREAITGVKSHLNNGLFATGKFYFANLGEIQSDPLNAKVTNGKSELPQTLTQTEGLAQPTI